MAVTLCSINGMLQEEEYNVPATTSLTSCDVLVPVSAMQVPNFTLNAAFSLIPGKMNCETLKTNKKLHLSPQTSGYNVSSSNCDNSEDGVGDSGDSFRSFNQPAYSNIIKLKLKSCSSLNRLHKKPYIFYKKGSAKSSAFTKYRPVPIDERKFVCPVCHRAFIQHNYLIRHMFSHQNKKPFSCDAKGCEKSNTNFTFLKHHKECYHNSTSVIQDSDAVSFHPDDIPTTSTAISETSGLEQLSSESQLQLNTSNQNQDTSKQIEVLLDTGNKYDKKQSQEKYNSQTINTAVSLVAQDYGRNTLWSQDINSECMLEKKRLIVENYLDGKEMHEQTASLKLPDYQNQSKENNFSNFSQQQQPGIVNSQQTQQLSLIVPKFQTSLRNVFSTVLTSYLVNIDVDSTPITSGGRLFQFLQKQTVFSSAIFNLLSNNSGTNVFKNMLTALQTSHGKICSPLVKKMLYSSQTLNLNYTSWMKELNITPKSFHPQFLSHHSSDQLRYLFTQGKPYNHSNNVTTDMGNISNSIQYTPIPVNQNCQVAMIPNSSGQLLSSETQSAASQLQFLVFLWSVSQNIGASSDSDRQKRGQCNHQIINSSTNLTDERLMPNTSHSEGTVNSEQALILQETTKNNSNIVKTLDDSDLMQLSKYQNQHDISSSEYQQPEILNSQQVHQLFPDVSSCQVSQINPSPTIFGHMIKTQDDSTICTTMEENSLSFCKQQDQTVDHLERTGSLTTCHWTSCVPNKQIIPGDPLLENNTLKPQDQPKFPNYLYLLVPRGQSEGLNFTQKAFFPPSYPRDHSYNKKPDSVSRLKSRKTKICPESRTVKCTLCHRKFKNRCGLNGHMKLHGGYRAQRCCYCLKPRANVRCCYIRCKKVFHFPHCGLKNYTLGEFIGKPDCYCINHRPRQEVREKNGRGSGVSDLTCSICLYHIENKESNDVLRAPCCMYTSFHRTCVQRLALHAGHFFKCPVCNNKDLFITEMWKHGIHTQERNTFFKQEENAFVEHGIKHCQCDATYCICPKGRKFNSEESDWEILVCKACGSRGCHLLCRDPDCPKPFWECPGCVDVTEKLKCRMSETKSNNSNDNDFMELKASGESHSELAHKVLLAQNKKRAENLVEVSATLEESGKERNHVTSVTDFDIREEMLHECKVKLVRLDDLYHRHQRDFPVMSFQDDNFKKKEIVSEEKNSKSFQISKQVIDSDKATQSKVAQKGSTNLSFDKSANLEHWSNPWKDFNDVNLTSNKPVFFQINHGVTPGMYRLDVYMRQDDGKPPVKLGFRNLSLPSVNANDTNQPISTVTLEQFFSDSVSRTKDENQSNCSSSSSEIRDFKSSSEEKVGPESVLRSSSSSSKNYLKESQLSRNVEHHYHSASHHLADNQGSKLQKPMHDHDIPDYISPTSNSKMNLETKDNRKQELHVSKVCDTTISSCSDVQIIDKPADINSRVESTTQSKCVSSDMNRFGDDYDTHCLSQYTAVDGNSLCGVASENEDQHCMATSQSIHANSTLTESVTTCISTSGVLKTAKYDTNQNNLTVFEITNSISGVHDKDQPVIKPEEIGIFSSGIETQELTKVDKVDLHNTEKSTSQKHHSGCGPYKYARDIYGQDQPVMESQEVTIFHSEDETEQGTEEDKVKLQITEELTSNFLGHLENSSVSTTENLDLPQDIDLTCDSNKTPEVTEVDRMELQKTFKPTNQNYCMFFVKNNNCSFQDNDLPIIVPEDLSLIHPTHRMELENTNRSTGKNDSIFVTEDNYKCASQEVQPIIVPQNLYLNDYLPTIPQVSEISRMELEKANKSTIQNDCMIIAENERTFQDEDLPVIVPQDMSLVYPTIKTPQITETDNMELKKPNKSRSKNDFMIIAESNNNCTFQNEDLPVIVPQDISLIPSALESPQVTEADNMELQITNVYSLIDSLEETSESDQMVEDILSTRQSEESRPPNPRDLRTPSPVLFEIDSSDESDCIILSDSETQTKDK